MKISGPSELSEHGSESVEEIFEDEADEELKDALPTSDLPSGSNSQDNKC